MTSISKLLLFSAVAMAPCVAHAQSAPAAPPAGASAPSGTDVVVTAQRREERLKNVPITIVAVSAKALNANHIDSGRGLNVIAPALNFAVQGALVNPTIRGIGSTLPSGDQANVALYVDGVYQPSEVGNLFEFNNVVRVEVLEGPQGTLFGRNATGGAIRIITRDPSYTPSADLGFQYGSFNQRKFNFYANTPIIQDRLAFNIAGVYDADDGYLHDVTLHKMVGAHTVGAIRAKFLWTPSDTVRFVLGFNYSDTNDASTTILNPVSRPGIPVYSTFENIVNYPTCAYCVSHAYIPRVRVTIFDTNLTGTWKVASGTATSITSFQSLKVPVEAISADNSALGLINLIDNQPSLTFTEELNYASAYSGPFNWTGGLYYYRNLTSTAPLIISFGPTALIQQTSGVHNDAYAAFGEIYYDVTPRLHLIGGLRYSFETKTQYAHTTIPVDLSYRTSTNWSSFTPRASIRYDLDDFSNVYFTFSQGFKSGVYTPSNNVTPAPALKPENLTAYEVGYKMARRNFSFSADAYYYDYSDLQVSIQNNNGGAVSTIYANAKKAQVYGVEAQANWIVNQNFSLQGGFAYTHATFVDFCHPKATCGVPLYKPNPIAGVPQPVDASFDLETLTVNPDGNRLIRTPEFAANVTANYTHPLAGGRFDGSITASYNSGFYWDPANTAHEPAYTLVNGEIAWTSPGDRYRVSVWSTNLTGTKYYAYQNQVSNGVYGVLGRPMSVGVEVRVHLQ